MTVSTVINRVDYVGNGATTVYAVPFPFFAGSDLDVYVDGVLKTLNTHYSVAITLDLNGAFSSANVTFVTAPLNTKAVAILRDLPLTQTVSTTNNSQLLPSIVEKSLDRLTLVNQDTLGRVSRTVQLGASVSGSVIITPSDGKYLAWSGSTLVNKSATEMAADAGSGVAAQVVTNTADIGTLLQNGTSPWTSTRAYLVGNLTSYNNDLWLCLVGNTNSAPTVFNANWVRVATRTGGAYALPTNYSDIRVNYTDANTITLLAGSRVRSSDDTTDIIFSADRTCVLNASGSNGLDTGSEAVNTWYYLYAIYNPTTLTSALVFSTVNESVSGSITLPSGFTKKRQLKFSVRNDGSSNILPFRFVQNNKVLYRDVEEVAGYTVLSSGGSGTFATVSTSILVPPISRACVISTAAGGSSDTGKCWTRETGTTISTGKIVGFSSFSSGNWRGPDTSTFEQTLNASQQYDYRVAGDFFTHFVHSYIVTEVL